MGDRHEGDERKPSEHLIIPYAADDRGRSDQRPLPGTLSGPPVAWNCPSVIVDGQPGTYVPGAPLKTRVVVRNHGFGGVPAPATVTLWWAEPFTGFPVLNLLGQASIAVPPDGKDHSAGPIEGLIPASAPAHLCLIAMVSGLTDRPAKDPASGKIVIDPVGDRHFAQYNLNAINAASGRFDFGFFGGNPFAEPARFIVRARAVPERALAALSVRMGAEPVEADGLDLGLRVLDGDAPEAEERGDRIAFDLRAGERRRLGLSGRLTPPPPGRFVAIQVLQDLDDGRGEGRLIGGVGVLLFG